MNSSLLNATLNVTQHQYLEWVSPNWLSNFFFVFNEAGSVVSIKLVPVGICVLLLGFIMFFYKDIINFSLGMISFCALLLLITLLIVLIFTF